MHPCMHTYMHTHIHACTYIHTHIHTYTHTPIHTYTYTHIHLYTHTCIHTYTQTHSKFARRTMYTLPTYEPSPWQILDFKLILLLGCQKCKRGAQCRIPKCTLRKEMSSGDPQHLPAAFIRVHTAMQTWTSRKHFRHPRSEILDKGVFGDANMSATLAF